MHMRYSLLIVFILVIGLLTGCPGGGHDEPRHAPVLSGFHLYPGSALQYDGNGSVQINVYFDFIDARGDLASLTLTVHDANGVELFTETDPLEGGYVTTGYLSGYLSADTDIAGSYSIEFYVTDSVGSRSNTVSDTFTVIPQAAVVSLVVTPKDPSIVQETAQQFTATATFSDSTVMNISSVADWSSSNTNTATINGNGAATGVSPGTVTITASYHKASGSTTLTVKPPPALVSIAVTPASSTIAHGTAQQFIATGSYDDGSTLDITSLATWSTSDENVASINYWGYLGRAFGKNRGTTTISATKGLVAGSTDLNVLSDYGPEVNYLIRTYQYLGGTAIGDLNGDGRNDVAVVDMFNNGPKIYVFYQKADHTLDSAQTITTDLNLNGLAIADIDNDGLAELIVAGIRYGENGGGKIYVYKQDPFTHALGTPQISAVSSFGATGLVVADVNNDGLPDVVVSGRDLSLNNVISFLFQDGSGTLASEVTYTGAPVAGGIQVADMNHDGQNDIVLQSDAKQLAVIPQVSPGIFSTTPDYYSVSTNYWPSISSFALGDLNNDGRTDIATVDIVSYGDLNILTQDSNGLFSGPTITLPHGADEIKIADIDGDGLNDIVMLVAGYQFKILYQAEDHTFTRVEAYPMRGSSQGLSIGDVSGDGLADIVTSSMDGWINILPRLPAI